MKFDSELAKQICEEMNIPFDENQNRITINGMPISQEFSAEKLFHGEYNMQDNFRRL